MIKGKDIFISLNSQSVPFAATRSNELGTRCGVIPTSSPSSADWETCRADRNSWTFTINVLVSNVSDLDKLLMAGNEYFITVYGRESDSVSSRLWGYALCTEAKFDMTVGSLVHGTFSFKGNGPLTNDALSSSDI